MEQLSCSLDAGWDLHSSSDSERDPSLFEFPDPRPRVLAVGSRALWVLEFLEAAKAELFVSSALRKSHPEKDAKVRALAIASEGLRKNWRLNGKVFEVFSGPEGDEDCEWVSLM